MDATGVMWLIALMILIPLGLIVLAGIVDSVHSRRLRRSGCRSRGSVLRLSLEHDDMGSESYWADVAYDDADQHFIARVASIATDTGPCTRAARCPWPTCRGVRAPRASSVDTWMSGPIRRGHRGGGPCHGSFWD